jgi:hypothetical protein
MDSKEDIFTMLKGTWHLQRTIENYGVMRGIAHISEQQSTMNEHNTASLYYREDGEFCISSGKKFNCHREYIYRFVDGKIIIFFAEQKKPTALFYQLDFVEDKLREGLLTATAEHQCQADNYQAFYYFYNRDTFRLNYKVLGRKKNYSSNTLFTRSH